MKVLPTGNPIQIQVHIKPAPVSWFSSTKHVLILIAGVLALLAGIVASLITIFGGMGKLTKALRKTKPSDPDPKAEQESTAARAEQ